MQYICDATPYTWFRLETEGEAMQESKIMRHAVERHFRQSYQRAEASYVPPAALKSFEQKIGLKAHIQRVMPLFLTLRDSSGKAHVTAMLPPLGKEDKTFRPIIVGIGNANPYAAYAGAIQQLGDHFGMTLDAIRCFPNYR